MPRKRRRAKSLFAAPKREQLVGVVAIALFAVGMGYLAWHDLNPSIGSSGQSNSSGTQRRSQAAVQAKSPATGTLEEQFEAGVRGNMSCPQLYEIRNKLRRGKPTAYQDQLNNQLKKVGCYHADAKRPAKPPTQKKIAYEDIDPNVKYADCDELRAHAQKFYSVLEKSGMRSATPEDIARNRAQMRKWHEEFYAMDIPVAKGRLEWPADLLNSAATQYGSAALAFDLGEHSPLSISTQLDICREKLEKTEAAFASAGCPLN